MIQLIPMEVIKSAILDADNLGPLYDELMPKDRPLAPEAVTIVPEVFRVIGQAYHPSSFLLFMLDMVTHEGGELLRPALRSHVRHLEEWSSSDDRFAAQLAMDLLGHCGPDDDLAARLKQRAGQDGPIVPEILISVARLQAGHAIEWLEGFLAPQHPPTVRVTAVAALRLAGSPVLAGMDDVLVSAWESDPDMLLPSDSGVSLKDLARYVGTQVLVRLGQSASPEVRAQVAGVLDKVTMPDHSLLRSLLEDPEEKVQKRAWRALCCTDELARQNADLLAKAISDGHPVQFSAANALAKLGDERALPFTLTAIREGKAGKALLRMLAEQDAPLDDETRDAVLERVIELAKLIDKPGHGVRPVSEFNALVKVIRWRGGLECVPGLVEALRHAEWLGAGQLRRCLVDIAGGDERAIEALAASSDGSLLHLAENWAAGGDEQALRRALAEAPPGDPLAARIRENLSGLNL